MKFVMIVETTELIEEEMFGVFGMTAMSQSGIFVATGIWHGVQRDDRYHLPEGVRRT